VSAEGGATEVSVANHPRASGAIRRARARTALIVAGLVLLLCLHQGVPAQLAVVRALVAGTAGFLVAWLIGVALWRQIVLAELRAAHEARRQRRRDQLAAAEARRAAQSAS
jgi:hypothetical protein